MSASVFLHSSGAIRANVITIQDSEKIPRGFSVLTIDTNEGEVNIFRPISEAPALDGIAELFNALVLPVTEAAE